jgi:non-ribosomal peptide synthetase component E (peptide arylation enzyme)
MSGNNFDNVPQCFQIPATEKPGFFAVRSGTGRVTYVGLVTRTDALCDRLTAAGIEKGALAGILLDRPISTITSFLAVLKADGAFCHSTQAASQINGLRGELDSVKKLQQRVAHDIKYIEKWSMWSENYSADARECYSSFLG